MAITFTEEDCLRATSTHLHVLANLSTNQSVKINRGDIHIMSQLSF